MNCACCGRVIEPDEQTTECDECGRMQCVHCDLGDGVCLLCEDDDEYDWDEDYWDDDDDDDDLDEDDDRSWDI